MKKNACRIAGVVCLWLLCGYLPLEAGTPSSGQAVSGAVVGGYRILPIADLSETAHFTVFRGDYIKFEFDGGDRRFVLEIPALSVRQEISGTPADDPYFKMKTAGTFPFSLGHAAGRITVVEYSQPHYRAVSAAEAAELIRNVHPLILDVRTPGEFQKGRLKNALLIPVQQLQARYREISGFQDRDILIYCATGNRSTVAAKVLIDNGFKRIYNLRHGIHDWHRNGFQIVH